MSMPVVGSTLFAVLCFGHFGDNRLPTLPIRLPTPSSQATTLALPGNESSSDDEDVSSNDAD